MTETIIFRPHLLPAIKRLAIYSFWLAVLLHLWNSSESRIYLFIAFIPSLAIISYLRPILFVQNVIIGKDKTITIRYWFGKGHTEKISKALYEIIKIDEDDIRSYRFNIQDRLFQVSPSVYERGDDLTEMLEPFTRQKDISIKSAIVRSKQ